MPSSITFTCQTITPMLMHGADGSSAELRPASIKGVLRFWWRAIHGDLPLNDLHEKEGEIFGSTEGRSSFSIRIKPKILTSKSQNALPHRLKPVNLNGFDVNQNFEVIISGQNLEPIKNLFILATTLGGFGQRSRRGFGSVQIVGSEALFSPEAIENLIKTINPKFSYTHQSKKKNEEYPYIQQIQIGKTYDTFDKLLQTIGEASHTYNCPELGSANPRLASPIYVSVIKDGTQYRPIITTLTNTNLENFKKAIL